MAAWMKQATITADRAHLRHVCSFYLPGRSSLPGACKTGSSQLRRVGGPGGLLVSGTYTTAAAGASPVAAGWTPSAVPRVCILGGGFGGLYAAVRLESLLWPRGTKPEITLVDRTERFVFKPLLYELIQGTAAADEVAPRFDKLLAPYATNFVQGSVKSVEPIQTTRDKGSAGGGRVILSNGASLDYDWLVLALGSETNTFGVPGAREHAITFCSFDDVQKIMSRIRELELRSGPSPVAVVVGAGYAGVELAATVAERLPSASVQIISSGDHILPGCPQGQREAASAIMRRYNISIVPNAKVSKIDLVPSNGSTRDTMQRQVTVEYKSGSKQDLPADLVMWTAGSAPTPAAKTNPLKLPFPSDERGSTCTDATLRVQGHSNVFALGDVAVPTASPEPLPATAQVAFQQADYVAWNVWAAINQRPLLPFKYQHLGEAMSLGKTNAAITAPFEIPGELSNVMQSAAVKPLFDAVGIRLAGSGSAKGLTIEGPLAGALRRGAYWYRQPTLEQRLGVGQAWLQRALTDARSALAGQR